MAEITVKGYVNKPGTRESAKGTFATFTLAERQKQKDGTFEKVYYDCIDFKNEAPPESSFVTVKGWLNQKRFQRKDGTEGIGHSINVQDLDIAPPREGAPKAAPAAAPEDPFDLKDAE